MPEASKAANKLIGAEEYAQRYMADMEFERHLISSRQDRCLEFLCQRRPRTVVEVGCGPDLLIDRFDLANSSIDQWLVVEPSSYADLIERRLADCKKLRLMRGYLEEAAQGAKAFAPHGFDAVLLSGLLHETTNPAALLASARNLLNENGSLFVSVPNASSYHRLLAVQMGLMESPEQLSPRNIELGQPIVYNRMLLETALIDAGFESVEFSGYMFKPFSNGQMGKVIEAIGTDIVTGLVRLGKILPDNAAEIAVVARKV